MLPKEVISDASSKKDNDSKEIQQLSPITNSSIAKRNQTIFNTELKNWIKPLSSISLANVQEFISFPALFSTIATSATITQRTALVFEKNTYTYLTLNEKINQLSHYLIDYCKNRGLPKESKVCAFLTPSDDAIIAILAIMKAGLVYVPLNTDSDIAPEKLIQTMHDSRPAFLLTHSHLLNHPLSAKISLDKTQLVVLDKEQAFLQQFPTHHPEQMINARDAAYLLYTSGSTGASKGVLVEHEGLYNRFLSHKKLLQITPGDSIALFASLGFDASIMEMMMALGSGAILYIVPHKIRLDILELGEFYKKNKITIAIFTPSMLRILEPKDFNDMRVIISTGEAIDKETFERWYWKNNAKTESRLFINGYGPVEATICTTLGVCTPETDLHIGQAVDGVEIFILEENFKDTSEEDPEIPKVIKRVTDGERGELYISGIGLARHYYGQDERITKLNNKRFFKIIHPDDLTKPPHQKRILRVYRSGDAMHILNGKLEFLDRIDGDRQVKIHGKLVSPEEIDAVLKKSPFIENAYVDIYINKLGHTVIDAYLIIKPQQKLDLEILYHSVAQTLTQTMCPSRWAIISKEQWAKSFNKSCKLDRHKLHQDPSINFQRLQSDPIVLPSDKFEEELMQLWKQVLPIDDKEKFIYSVNDDFRYLGGTSVQAANLIANINLKYPQLKLTPDIFFRNPTISNIARKIRRQATSQSASINPAEYFYPVISLTDRFPLKIHQSQTGLPLFFIHSLLGNPLVDYGNILEKWPSHRPIYAIQARGIRNAKDMDTTLEEIALDYIEAITKIQPLGPYLLVGWSSGGVIAATMANHLKERGEQVAVLAIDSTHPTVIRNMSSVQFADYLLFIVQKTFFPMFTRKELNITAKELAQFARHGQINYLIEVCKKHPQILSDRMNQLITIKEILLAITSSTSIISEKEITILATSDTQKNYGNLLGWSTAVQMIDSINGDHFSIVKDSSLVKQLTEKIINFAELNEGLLSIIKLKDEFQKELEYYYTTHEKNIKRIDGKLLLLQNCFINLAIIKQDQQAQVEKFKVKSNVGRIRLYSCYEDIYNTVEKEVIEPEHIFKERHGKLPKRIKIVGKAGVGKSTLAQYMSAYLWAVKKCWHDKFAAVLRIKLRDLIVKPYKNDPSIANIIKLQCLDKSDLTQTMSVNDIKKLIKTIPGEILFIIDSWEEFNQRKSPCKENILDLLDDPKISLIVLTRPFSNIDSVVKNFDLVLECIGFTSENIPKYIENVCDNKDYRYSIMKFLKNNPAIFALAHVPIILNILCIIWDSEIESYFQSMNMTEIYKIITVKMFEFYMRKQMDTCRKISEEELTKNKNQLKKCLETLAMRAMENDSIIINRKLLNKVIKECFKCADEDVNLYFERLVLLGFLHTSEIDQEIKAIYFIHLTFQEYFAAQYWVNSYLSNNKSEYDEAINIFINDKFNPRYEMIWVFVAGLLREQPMALHNYINLIEKEPVDLIKLKTNTLLIRCLEESILNVKEQYKDRIINSIAIYVENAILNFEKNKLAILSSYFQACPNILEQDQVQNVVAKLLNHSNDQVKLGALEICTYINKYTIEIINNLIIILKGENQELKLSAVCVFVSKKVVPHKILMILLDFLGVENDIRVMTSIVLEDISSMSLDAYWAMLDHLRSEDQETRAAAADILVKIPEIPEVVLMKLAENFMLPDIPIIDKILSILNKIKVLPIKMLVLIIKFGINNSKYDYIDIIVRAFNYVKLLSADDIAKIVLLRKDSDDNLREGAAWILSQTQLNDSDSENIFFDLVYDTNKKVINIAIDKLSKSHPENQRFINNFLLLVHDKREEIRLVAMQILIKLNLITEKMFSIWVIFLKDKNERVRLLATQLSKSIQFTSTYVGILFEILKSDDQKIKDNIVSMIDEVESFPLELQSIAIRSLADQNDDIRLAASSILGKIRPVTPEILSVIADHSKDINYKLREAAAWVYCEINPFPYNAISNVVDLSNDEHEDVRYAGVYALTKIRPINSVVIIRLLKLLNDSNEELIELCFNVIYTIDHDLDNLLIQLINAPINNNKLKTKLILSVIEKIKAIPVQILLMTINLIGNGYSFDRVILDNMLFYIKVISPDDAIEFIHLLDNHNGLINQIAARALTKMDPVSVDLLIDLLEKQIGHDFQIETIIDDLLNKIDCIDIKYIDKFTLLINHENWHVRKQVPKFIAKVNIKSEALYKLMLNLLINNDSDFSISGANAFESNELHPYWVMKQLVQMANSAVYEERLPAVVALTKINHPNVIIMLIELLDTTQINIVTRIIDRLLKMHPFPAEAFPNMIKNLMYDDQFLKSYIIETINRILSGRNNVLMLSYSLYDFPQQNSAFYLEDFGSKQSLLAISNLFTLLQSDNQEIQEIIKKVFDNVKLPLVEIQPLLNSLVSNKNVVIRKMLVKFITKIKPFPKEYLKVLECFASDECIEIRLELAHRIFKVSPITVEVIEIALLLLKDKNLVLSLFDSLCKQFNFVKSKKTSSLFKSFNRLSEHCSLPENYLLLLVELSTKLEQDSPSVIVQALDKIKFFTISSLPLLLNLGKLENINIKKSVSDALLRIEPFSIDLLVIIVVYNSSVITHGIDILKLIEYLNCKKIVWSEFLIKLDEYIFDSRTAWAYNVALQNITFKDLITIFQSNLNLNIVFAINLKSCLLNVAIYFDTENNICFYENGKENKIKLNIIQKEVFLKHINTNKINTLPNFVVDYCDSQIRKMSITM